MQAYIGALALFTVSQATLVEGIPEMNMAQIASSVEVDVDSALRVDHWRKRPRQTKRSVRTDRYDNSFRDGGYRGAPPMNPYRGYDSFDSRPERRSTYNFQQGRIQQQCDYNELRGRMEDQWKQKCEIRKSPVEEQRVRTQKPLSWQDQKKLERQPDLVSPFKLKHNGVQSPSSSAEDPNNVLVCDEESGICEHIHKSNAPTDNKACKIESMVSIDQKTGKLSEEKAVICDLTPLKKYACDPITGVCKTVIEPKVQYPVPDFEPTASDHDLDLTVGRINVLNYEQFTPEHKTILQTDNGHLEAPHDDANVLHSGSPTEHTKCAFAHVHEPGMPCPLCGALPEYQKLVWTLPQYEEMVGAVEPAFEEKARREPLYQRTPISKVVTVCESEQGICEEKVVPFEIDIESEIPKRCKISDIVLPNRTVKSVVLCDSELPPVPKTQSVTVCDAQKQRCEIKSIPGHIDIQETMPDRCRIVEKVHPDNTVEKIVVCNEEKENQPSRTPIQFRGAPEPKAATQTVTVCDGTGKCRKERIPSHLDIMKARPEGCSVEKIGQEEIVICASKARSPIRLMTAPEPEPELETQEVTVCDARTKACELKEIAGHIDIENTLPSHCELRNVKLPDGTTQMGVVICHDYN